MEQLAEHLQTLQSKVNRLIHQIGIPTKESHIDEMEAKVSAPDLWADPTYAQSLLQELAKLKKDVNRWRELQQRTQDAYELAMLEDEAILAEIETEYHDLESLANKMELEIVFSGSHDNADAILAIHAGAGGTDSQDWAQMLERMYFRWAEANGHSIEIIERSDGEEAGIKSMMAVIRGGDYPFGYLQSEQGVHRLVRQSPFDSSARRHTSFAKVELWPDIKDDIEIEINPNDIRVDTYRSGGAGGQHLQKNDTAVRLTHIPTGIVVQCQNQRSQAQNRERALQILKARLFEIERHKQEATLAELKGENVDAGWGNQIRSYVLHPYQMVKDHRTNYEVGNTASVLDGNLNGFMESYLRAQLERLNKT
ncbi:MAG: peptide chain release factor 2 [Phototrophicaceae bacterium]